MGTELSGQTLGLVGLGHIGTRVLKLGTAFGMKVLACDPYIDKKEILARGAQPVSLDELVASSDIVSLHCPRTHETMNLFNAARFAKMKRGRSEEHTSELQSLMRISYAVFCLKQK